MDTLCDFKRFLLVLFLLVVIFLLGIFHLLLLRGLLARLPPPRFSTQHILDLPSAIVVHLQQDLVTALCSEWDRQLEGNVAWTLGFEDFAGVDVLWDVDCKAFLF